MAKKTFAKNIAAKHDIKNMVSEIEMDDLTKESLLNIEKNPTKENIINAIDYIKEDLIIPVEEKPKIIEAVRNSFIELFNFENCPDDYESLKQEAKFLVGMTQYSFLLMAQRLKKIRDNKLYENDGYLDFKAFIESEINVARSTAYNYIDIIDCFGVQPVGHDDTFEYAKLLPFVPILKANNSNIPKEEIKRRTIAEFKNKTKREMQEEAKELKIKYGIAKESKKDIAVKIKHFIRSLPDIMTTDDLKKIKAFFLGLSDYDFKKDIILKTVDMHYFDEK